MLFTRFIYVKLNQFDSICSIFNAQLQSRSFILLRFQSDSVIYAILCNLQQTGLFPTNRPRAFYRGRNFLRNNQYLNYHGI